jgi:CPA2 family monovalent cation:H+ antiporter-2
LSFTVANSVIPVTIADKLLLVVALSMLLTPILFIIFDKVIAPRYASEQKGADEITEQNDIIIIGHGRVGGIVNRMLRGAGYETTVIDYSSTQLEMLRRFDLKVFFGDGTRPDLLHSAGIDNAKMLVVAIDHKEHTTELVRYVAATYPHVHITARARDRTHVYDLWSVGCRDIIRETYDSSLRMGRSAYEALGHSAEQSTKMVEEFNMRDRKAMIESAGFYKFGVPLSENPEFVEKAKEVMREWEDDLIGQEHMPGDEHDDDAPLTQPQG